jgi:hypothetical protein
LSFELQIRQRPVMALPDAFVIARVPVAVDEVVSFEKQIRQRKVVAGPVAVALPPSVPAAVVVSDDPQMTQRRVSAEPVALAVPPFAPLALPAWAVTLESAKQTIHRVLSAVLVAVALALPFARFAVA